MAGRFTYCPHCAAPLVDRVVNDQVRSTCPACDFVHWRNPAVGVAVIVVENGRILLGQRARGRYRGAWCIPCGYVEHDEDVRAAAVREFAEETGLLVELGEVYAVRSNFHNPALHTVGIWFRGTILRGELCPQDDLSAAAWFDLRQLPQAIAFPTDVEVLARWRAGSVEPYIWQFHRARARPNAAASTPTKKPRHKAGLFVCPAKPANPAT